MAVNWYLMNTNHDTVSGFESEDYKNFAKDAFEESLETAISERVEICNYNLTEREEISVVITGSLQDTKLNSLQRQMLSPIGSCKAGQYVYYKDRYWLIVGLVDGNNIYDKCVMILCNYLLTWVNQEGKVIQRWANVSSASQYNNGETSTAFYFVKSDQLMVLTPDDDESLLIKHKQRFIIDKRCKVYEKNYTTDTTVDTSKQLNTYELTRMDNVIYDYQDSGHSEFMATQCEKQTDDGYYVIDDNGYWVCDYNRVEEKLNASSCKIEYDDNVIVNGIEPAIFTAKLVDSDGNVANNISPQWEINCEFVDSLNIEYVENSICISVDNKKLINKSFELSLKADGFETDTVTITITAFI